MAADDSYYSVDFDFSVSSGTEAAATTSLPPDFYKMRGLTRWPDTARATTVIAQPYAYRNSGAPGYVLRGNALSIVPWRFASMAGDYRLTYAPLPPRLGRAIDISVYTNDRLFAGSAGTHFISALANFAKDDGQFFLAPIAGTRAFGAANAFTVTGAGDVFEPSDVGTYVYVSGASISGNNNIFPIAAFVSTTQVTLGAAPPGTFPAIEAFGGGVIVGFRRDSGRDSQPSTLLINDSTQLGNDGEWTIDTVLSKTECLLVGAPAPEAFTADAFVSLVDPRMDVPTLDAILSAFRQYVIAYVAAKCLDKKKQDASGVMAMMADEMTRVKESAPLREGEPEQAPVLWRARGYRGWGGAGGNWGW